MTENLDIEFVALDAPGSGRNTSGKFYIGILDPNCAKSIHGAKASGGIRTTDFRDTVAVRGKLREKQRGEYSPCSLSDLGQRARAKLLEVLREAYPSANLEESNLEDGRVRTRTGSSGSRTGRRPRSRKRLSHSWI